MKGVIAVAILGSEFFDPTSLDPSMRSFNFCGGTQTAHDLTDPDVFSDHCIEPYYDEWLDRLTANDDLYPDLVIHACLSGYDRQDVMQVELEVVYNGGHLHGLG